MARQEIRWTVPNTLGAPAAYGAAVRGMIEEALGMRAQAIESVCKVAYYATRPDRRGTLLLIYETPSGALVRTDRLVNIDTLSVDIEVPAVACRWPPDTIYWAPEAYKVDAYYHAAVQLVVRWLEWALASLAGLPERKQHPSRRELEP